jgi:hypothetical protein
VHKVAKNYGALCSSSNLLNNMIFFKKKFLCLVYEIGWNSSPTPTILKGSAEKFKQKKNVGKFSGKKVLLFLRTSTSLSFYPKKNDIIKLKNQ